MSTKVKSVARAKAVGARVLSAAGRAPTQPEVQAELLAFWDGFSPLSLAALTIAYGHGASLDDAGVMEDDAATFVNKYNSIVLRAPGKGPLVRASEARAWHTDPMKGIVEEVTARAQP